MPKKYQINEYSDKYAVLLLMPLRIVVVTCFIFEVSSNLPPGSFLIGTCYGIRLLLLSCNRSLCFVCCGNLIRVLHVLQGLQIQEANFGLQKYHTKSLRFLLIVHPHILMRATSEWRVPTLVTTNGSHWLNLG